MATKKAAAKKTTSSSKTRVTKVSASNSKSKLSKLPVSIYKEQNPEKHKLTGKYKALFVFLSVGLGIFAAIAVWEFAYSVKLLEQYQRIEACARIGERCEPLKKMSTSTKLMLSIPTLKLIPRNKINGS